MYCKEKKTEVDDKEVILQQLLDEMVQLKVKLQKIESNNIINSNNTTNNQTINNNTQNITNNYGIVAFGKEKLDEIVSDDDCKKILFKGFEAVPKLVEYVHFNEKIPQYHNCYIPNIRGKYAIIYDGDNWTLKNIDDVIESLRDSKRTFLENKFDDFYDSLCENTKKKFHRFLLEADTDAVINRYKESLMLLLYNKRGVVLGTRNKINVKSVGMLE
jgi:hypothetical protein